MKILRFKYCYFTFLLISYFGAAQTKADSILNHIQPEVLNKPDWVIKTAEGILKNENINDKTEINAFLIISNAYSNKRNYEKALEYAEKAKLKAIHKKDKYLQLRSISRITSQYYQLKLYDKALKYLDEADKIEADFPYKDSIRKIKGNNYTLRGLIYKNNLNCNLAITYFNKAIEEYKTKPDDQMMIIDRFITMDNLGFCQMLINQTNEAEKTFNDAIEFGKTIEGNNGMGYSHLGLAHVYMLQHNYQKARLELNTALSYAWKLDDPFLDHLLYELLAFNSVSQNNWEGYSFYQKKYLDISKKTSEQEKNFMNMTVKNLSDNRKAEIEKVKKKYIFQYAGLTGFIFLIIFLISKNVFNTKKQIKRYNETIISLSHQKS